MLPSDCILRDVIEIGNQYVNVSIYPNPSSEILTIELSNKSLLDKDDFMELIYIHNRKIKTIPYDELNYNNIDFKDLKNGIFF